MTRADGFTPFLVAFPQPGILLRFWEETTNRQWSGYAEDIHPLANCAYIWHKTTAIGRMQMGLD